MIEETVQASLGLLEVGIILVIVILIFGPRKIGDLLKSFKKGKDEMQDAMKDDGEKDE